MNECCKWNGNGDSGFAMSCKGKTQQYCPYCGKKIIFKDVNKSWENCNKPITYGEWSERENK